MKKRWLLGITGGIAAYKTPELVRLLKKQGAEVRVVMTKNAQAFVTPLTLQTLSQTPVYTELMDPAAEAAMSHIELARWAEGILIAPLSANRLASLALGMAEDLLGTLCLVTTAPIYVAPAMNQQMWHHPATQKNLHTLQEHGVIVLGPAEGEQACGEFGLGRMLEPEDIVNALNESKPLEGLSIVITAGPTREYLDPVRFISNRSSGKMGFALAETAQEMGAKVTLISGPVHLSTPQGVQRVPVESAEEMKQAVEKHIEEAEIFISTAAVADFKPKQYTAQKIKKHERTPWPEEWSFTSDILAEISKRFPEKFRVGFAAETHHHEEYAQQKREDKNLDLVALNDVSREDIGFESEDNALTVFGENKKFTIEKSSKKEVAKQLLKIIKENYDAKY
jgi:phosphopantothenoylcysteine decarboxylase/phosphopantothenate--cysteine ligase